MTPPTSGNVRRAGTLAALALSGCISYAAPDLQRMSAYDLCEAQLYSRWNLTADTKSRVSAELARRNEDCRGETPRIDADRAAEAYDDMYGRSGP